MRPWYFHPAHLGHGYSPGAVELDDGTVAGEIGHEDVGVVLDVEHDGIVDTARTVILVPVSDIFSLKHKSCIFRSVIQPCMWFLHDGTG